MTAGGNGCVVLTDKDCLNPGGAQLYAQGSISMLNLFFYLIYILTHELPLHLLIKERA